MRIKAVPTGLALMFLSLTLLWTGCSNESSTLSDAPGELNLTSEFGGYEATDEAPYFGDAEMAGLMKEDQPVDDPAFSTGDMDSLVGLPDREIYTLAIRWGMLEFDSSVTQETDWSGSLHLTHGFLHLNRLLRFEPVQDYIIRPRPDRQTLEWVSKTTVSFDGLIVSIILPPVPEGEDWSDNALTFQAGAYSRTFTIGELDGLNAIVDVDQLGNQIAFNGRHLSFEPCGGGHLDGRWVLNPSGQNGNFFGRWITDDGLLRGHVRGHFGARPHGEMVFFGKYIDASGRLRGMLRGTWGPNLDDPTSGWFDGIWADRDGRPIGKLGGNWSSTPPPDGEPMGEGRGHGQNPRNHPVFGANDPTPGFFGGWWLKLCPDIGGTSSDSE